MSDAAVDIAAAVRRLREGGVVAFPTETVYGLGADAISAAAVARVFELKGRPAHNPLIVHVTGPEMAARVAELDERSQRLARAFWPGPLSIVAPKRACVPGIVTGGGASVAVRCPDHPVALALLFEFDGPLVGPSANRSGQVSPTRAEHVRGVWGEDEVLVLEGGACRGGIESTVVMLSAVAGEAARILRPGLVSGAEVAKVIGEEVVMGGAPATLGAPLLSPGMLDRHYAPSTPARLVDAGEIERITHGAGPRRYAVLAQSPIDVPPGHEFIEMPTDAEAYAAALYDALRGADQAGAAEILIERPMGRGHVWEAVLDRLRRATARE